MVVALEFAQFLTALLDDDDSSRPVKSVQSRTGTISSMFHNSIVRDQDKETVPRIVVAREPMECATRSEGLCGPGLHVSGYVAAARPRRDPNIHDDTFH